MSVSKKLRALNRARVEHDNVKLSMQFAANKDTMKHIADSVMASHIEAQAAQIEMLLESIERCRNWFETQAKVISKGSFPSLERLYTIAFEAGRIAEREEIALSLTPYDKPNKSEADHIADAIAVELVKAIRARGERVNDH